MSFDIILIARKKHIKGRWYFIIFFRYFKDYNFDFEKFKSRVHNNVVHIDAYFIPENEVCPTCGSTLLYKNGHTTKTIKHCTYHTNLFLVKCHIQNYKCKDCNTIFREKISFANPNETLSKESIIIILDKLKYANTTFESVARDLHISRQNVIDVFDRYIDYSPGPLPEYLSWDEKHINKSLTENAYMFIMLDFKTNKIYDILYSRHKYRLEYHFSRLPIEERLKVKYITMDMWEPYLHIAKIYFKKAKIAIDSFHVMEAVNNAMNKVRLIVMQKYNRKTENLDDNHPFYYALKKYRYYLVKNFDDITNLRFYNKKLKMWFDKFSLREYLLKIDSRLSLAYDLTTAYRDFNKTASTKDCADEMDKIIDLFYNSNLEPFKDVAKTLSTWKEYILNSFIKVEECLDKDGNPRRLSNGPIEGINSIIEKINVNGNGYTNFWRFRNRCIYVINKDVPILNTPKKKTK